MFQHVILAKTLFKQLAKYQRGLFDDAGVGNDNDNAPEAVCVAEWKLRITVNDMLQGERERRQRFAAAGRRSKREEARRFLGRTQAVAAKLAAKRIDCSL